MNFFMLTAACWWVLLAIWIVTAPSAKRTVYRQSPHARFLPNAGILLAFLMVYNDRFSVGALGRRVLAASPIWGWLGLLICASGVIFAIAARFTLGRNWSGIVELKEQHELVTRGPYRIVRHPIYTGFLVGLLGSAIAVGLLRGFVGVAILFVAFASRVHAEERLMMSEFPDQYPAYRQRAKALIPYLY